MEVDRLHLNYPGKLLDKLSSGLAAIQNARLAIVGCRALGTRSAEILVRSGIGHLTLIDADPVDMPGLAVDTLFGEEDADFGEPRAILLQEKLEALGLPCSVEALHKRLNAVNAEELLQGHDLILDGSADFETRMIISDVSRKLDIPWIYGAMLGSQGVLKVFMPEVRPCFRCFLKDLPDPAQVPGLVDEGSLAAIASVMAGLQTTEAIRLLEDTYRAPAGEMILFDFLEAKVQRLILSSRSGCELCENHKYEFLQSGEEIRGNRLCGVNGVQFTPPPGFSFDTGKITAHLERRGSPTLHEDVIYFRDDANEVTIYPDGRTVIKAHPGISPQSMDYFEKVYYGIFRNGDGG